MTPVNDSLWVTVNIFEELISLFRSFSIVYKGTKLSTFFSTKENVKDMHCTKLVYYYKGSGGEERDDYVGETKCRMGKRTQQH